MSNKFIYKCIKVLGGPREDPQSNVALQALQGTIDMVIETNLSGIGSVSIQMNLVITEKEALLDNK